GSDIVVDDGTDALGMRDRGAIGRPGEVDVESFVGLDLGVAIDDDRDGLAEVALSEVQNVGLADIVFIGRGRGAVRSRVIHVEGSVAAGARYGKGLDLRAVVAFRD